VLIAKALAHEPEILFLDEPTAGVDVELRKDMWAVVRALRTSGVTIILTTHYIDEAEEMADRIGVISKGEIILVEEKAELMRKLGKKQLALQLQAPLDAVPDELAGEPLELSDDGLTLVYTFDAQAERTGIATLLRRLVDLGIGFKDLHSSESSLEDIFVSLVQDDPRDASKSSPSRGREQAIADHVSAPDRAPEGGARGPDGLGGVGVTTVQERHHPHPGLPLEGEGEKP
jgi:ABC-2 type transport system ATP-binding protein